VCRLRLPRRAPRNVAHESTVTRSQSAASANAISNLPGSRLPITEPAQKAGTADCRIHVTIGSNSIANDQSCVDAAGRFIAIR